MATLVVQLWAVLGLGFMPGAHSWATADEMVQAQYLMVGRYMHAHFERAEAMADAVKVGAPQHALTGPFTLAAPTVFWVATTRYVQAEAISAAAHVFHFMGVDRY